MKNTPGPNIENKDVLFSALPLEVGVMCKRIKSALLHMHNCSELWYCMHGEAEHLVGNEKFTQTPGSCVIVPAFTPHKISTKNSKDIPIFISVNVCDFAFRSYGHNFFSFFNSRIFFEGKILPFFSSFSGKTKEKADKIARELTTEFSKQPLPDFAKMFELYAELLHLMGGESTNQKISISKLERTKTILETISYIHNNYRKKITIPELCQLAKMSKPCFSEYFKDITGLSPMNYLMGSRITVAKMLFSTKGFSMTKAATHTGFFDAAHFTHAFTSYCGITPTEYKKRYKVQALHDDRQARNRNMPIQLLRDSLES